MTLEQREIVFAALENELILKPILTTFAFTGLRPGELIALKWCDIDFKESSISIRRAVNRKITFDEYWVVTSRELIVANTKTIKSIRSFVIPGTVINCLKEWRKYQCEQEQKTGISFTSDNCFVFSTKTGIMRTYNGLRSLLVRFLKKNGLKDSGINL